MLSHYLLFVGEKRSSPG